MPTRLIALLPLPFVLAAGCSAPGAGTDGGPIDLQAARDFARPPPICTDGTDGGPPPTLASVELITKESCVSIGCHGSATQATQFPGFDLRPGHVYASVVNVAASESCGGMLVVPGHPESSYFYQKIANPKPTCNSPDAGGFLQMPRCEDGSCPIRSCEIEIVRQWIAAGALP